MLLFVEMQFWGDFCLCFGFVSFVGLLVLFVCLLVWFGLVCFVLFVCWFVYFILCFFASLFLCFVVSLFLSFLCLSLFFGDTFGINKQLYHLVAFESHSPRPDPLYMGKNCLEYTFLPTLPFLHKSI